MFLVNFKENKEGMIFEKATVGIERVWTHICFFFYQMLWSALQRDENMAVASNSHSCLKTKN